jgi:hypothetical protein
MAAAGPRRSDANAFVIEGLSEFRRDLKRIAPETDKAVGRRLRTIARQVRDDARNRAPVQSGALRKSIKHSVTQAQMSLVSNLAYATVHEWGTKEPLSDRTRIRPQGVPIRVPRSQMLGGAVFSAKPRIEGQIIRIFEDVARGNGFDD